MSEIKNIPDLQSAEPVAGAMAEPADNQNGHKGKGHNGHLTRGWLLPRDTV